LTMDRALVSSAVQARCSSRPTTTDRSPSCVTFAAGEPLTAEDLVDHIDQRPP
jgi:hypothetical protein